MSTEYCGDPGFVLRQVYEDLQEENARLQERVRELEAIAKSNRDTTLEALNLAIRNRDARIAELEADNVRQTLLSAARGKFCDQYEERIAKLERYRAAAKAWIDFIAQKDDESRNYGSIKKALQEAEADL